MPQLFRNTLRFADLRIVNFALGAFMAIGAYLCWYLTDEIGISYPLAVVLAVVGRILFGVTMSMPVSALSLTMNR
jgi:branched-subunit amino acid ABC-type transport system permease component